MSEITVSFPDFPDVPALSNSAFGEGHWLVNIENWFDGVGSRNEDAPRPDSDGDYDQDPVYSDARYPIVTGRVRFDDEAQLFAARAPFARLMASRSPLTIQVESLEGTQQATVVKNGKLGWDLSRAPWVVEFELPFKAADPRKYGPAKSQSTGVFVPGGGVVSPVTSPFSQIGGGSPGRVVLTNDGTTDTTPTFTVTGGMSEGFGLLRIETGELIRCTWPLLLGDVARVDPAEGQVWLNEQSPISGYLDRADWWSLGPGESATVQFIEYGTVTGTPTLTAGWKDADA